VEENAYCPFGLLQQGISSKAAGRLENKIKYNGIALEKALDLNVYDAQFRELDPQVGRWWEIDPKTDEMYMWSTYASNFDNPIRFEDHLGDVPGSCCPETMTLWQWFTQAAASNGPIVGKPILVVGAVAVTGYAAWEAVKPTDAQIAATNAAWVKADAQMSSIGGTYTMGTTTTAGKSYAKPGQAASPAMSAAASTGIKTFVAQMKGAQNAKVKESAKTGQEAHRQIQKDLEKEGAKPEVTMELKDGTKVRKDALKQYGTAVIIKPNTKTGQKSAEKREQLMKKNGIKTETIYYNPNDPKYQPGSPTYIGPKKQQ
jgi:RHS repeat-associated protein